MLRWVRLWRKYIHCQTLLLQPLVFVLGVYIFRFLFWLRRCHFTFFSSSSFVYTVRGGVNRMRHFGWWRKRSAMTVNAKQQKRHEKCGEHFWSIGRWCSLPTWSKIYRSSWSIPPPFFFKWIVSHVFFSVDGPFFLHLSKSFFFFFYKGPFLILFTICKSADYVTTSSWPRSCHLFRSLKTNDCDHIRVSHSQIVR